MAQYLSHDGYVETAKAFASEVRAEATALTGTPDSKLEGYLSVEEDHDAMNRQRERLPQVSREAIPLTTSQKSALPSSTATLTKPSSSPTRFIRTFYKIIPKFTLSSAAASS